MKSHFETEIKIPQAKLAELYANPENNIKWMSDIKEYEPLSGQSGMPGAKYRLIPKKGKMIFTVTVTSRDLPNALRLHLDSSNVDVSLTGRFIALSPNKTKFISEEVFQFKGAFNKIFGFFAKSAIERAHHKHMNDFKRFAEGSK